MRIKQGTQDLPASLSDSPEVGSIDEACMSRVLDNHSPLAFAPSFCMKTHGWKLFAPLGPSKCKPTGGHRNPIGKGSRQLPDICFRCVPASFGTLRNANRSTIIAQTAPMPRQFNFSPFTRRCHSHPEQTAENKYAVQIRKAEGKASTTSTVAQSTNLIHVFCRQLSAQFQFHIVRAFASCVSACSKSYPTNCKPSPTCNPRSAAFARCRLAFRDGSFRAKTRSSGLAG